MCDEPALEVATRLHHGEFIVKCEKIVVARDKLTQVLLPLFSGEKNEI